MLGAAESLPRRIAELVLTVEARSSRPKRDRFVSCDHRGGDANVLKAIEAAGGFAN